LWALLFGHTANPSLTCRHHKATPATKNKSRKHMPANTERRSSHTGTGAARRQPSEILPSRQSLLAALAKVDFEHQSDIDTVRNSSADEWLKQATIRNLEEHHRKRRAPYLRQLESLQRQTQALAA
jgi:hypothetical protein